MNSRKENRPDNPQLKPKLRFPSFVDAPEWGTQRLEEFAEFYKGKGIAKSDIDMQGATPCIRYGELYTTYGEVIYDVVSRTSRSTAGLFFSKKGDVIIPSSGETKLDIATASCVMSNDIALGSDLNIIRSPEDGRFLSYQLNGPAKTKIAKIAQGDAVVHLYIDQLKKIKIALPQEEEQEKIVNTLSSVQDLVLEQQRKVNKLVEYRKGLMQQVFPMNGAAMPELRFPEFQSEPKWKKIKLGDLLVETPRPIKMKNDEEYSLVTVKRRYGGVVPRERLKGKAIKVKSQFLVKEDDFLISKRQIVHNACGLVPKDLEGAIVSNEYSVMTPRKGCDINFFNYFSQRPTASESFLRCSVGIVIEKMLFKLDSWLKEEFYFPSLSEQERIAACLASIDDLIEVHTKKLEALKEHKKGLMQQLFPAL